jgi:hypothetical protein
LLLDIQQIIAPRQRVAQGLLPDRGILRPTRQYLQAMSQACQESLWGKHFDARCCQFDGQRQPIQAHTDLGDGMGTGGSHLEVGPGSLRTVQEEGHGRILGEGFAPWKMGKVRQRQWWDGKLVLATDVQHSTTGHQHLELRAVGQQV